jgi:hypothetical protein
VSSSWGDAVKVGGAEVRAAEVGVVYAGVIEVGTAKVRPLEMGGWSALSFVESRGWTLMLLS